MILVKGDKEKGSVNGAVLVREMNWKDEDNEVGG